MGRYLDSGVLKDFCRSTSVKDIGTYEAATLAAEDFLDGELGRRVETATTATARTFRPNGLCSTMLFVDDFAKDAVTFTTLTISENGTTLTLDTDYVLEPLNGRDFAGRPVPYSALSKVAGYWYSYGPKPMITITAHWGWPGAIPTVAPMIYEAAKVCGKAYVEYRDIRFGLAALSEQGGVGERQAKAVWDAIGDYQTTRATPLR